jgi:trehalose 6-phosphate synthase
MAHWLPAGIGDHGWGWRERAGSVARPLAAAVAARDGTWIGFSRTPGVPAHPAPFADLWLHPVALTQRDLDDYYHGHCAGTLNPLYHDCGEPPRFRQRWGEAYREINHRFAMNAAHLARRGATVWVHDYHLQLVPGYLRRVRPDLRIGFLLHVPFPPIERFWQQPMRTRMLHGLLGADLVGFQQVRSAANFLDLASEMTGLRRGEQILRADGRHVAVGAFPMSVDVAAIERLAADPGVRERARSLRESLGNPRTVLLSTGAVEHADGVERRLEAFAQLLAEGRLDPAETVLIHVTACGEEDFGPRSERDRIDRQVAQINGMHSRVGHPVVHYVRHGVDQDELVALYTAADVMLALPLRQGMTLAAKEFVAARLNDTGRLVLSEFTGAVADLPEAVVVNPHDIEAVKNGICRAVNECQLPEKAIAATRRRLRDHDAARSVDGFLAALDAATAERALPSRDRRPALPVQARA